MSGSSSKGVSSAAIVSLDLCTVVHLLVMVRVQSMALCFEKVSNQAIGGRILSTSVGTVFGRIAFQGGHGGAIEPWVLDMFVHPRKRGDNESLKNVDTHRVSKKVL